MGLQQLWFGVIAALFLGFFFLEGFDFGVGMLMEPFARVGIRRSGDPPARSAQHHRPGLGWQRGLADHRRRSDVRRVSRLVRHRVLHAVSAAAGDPVRHDPAGRWPSNGAAKSTIRSGVPWPILVSRLGPGCPLCCGVWRSPSWSADSQWTPAVTFTCRSPMCSTRTPCWAAWLLRGCFCSTARCSSL